MLAASPTLQALLASQQFLMADLYTLTLVGGHVARYTSADFDISHGGQTYAAAGGPSAPIIHRSRIRQTIGVEVDTLTLDIAASASHLLNGKPWLAALRLGALDGARIQVDRAFFSAWTAAPEVLPRFAGRVAEIEVGRLDAKITVKCDLELLNVQMPRWLYQPGCRATLFDQECAINKATKAVAATVSSGATTTVIPCGLAQAAGYFSLGTITFSSGVNAGVSRSVRSYTPGSLTLALPLVTAPANGDAFTAWPGCDKTLATCETKFANRPNYRGLPFIPIPESVT